MRRNAGKWLEDIVTAGRDVAEFLERRSLEDYMSDKALRASVERKLLIAGEAVAQLRVANPKTADALPDALDIVAFRNILVHGYFALDHSRVYDIAVNTLPDLVRSAETLLESNEG